MTNSSAFASIDEAPLSAVLTCSPTPKSWAEITPTTPEALTVVAVSACAAIVLPDCAVKVLAVN